MFTRSYACLVVISPSWEAGFCLMKKPDDWLMSDDGSRVLGLFLHPAVWVHYQKLFFINSVWSDLVKGVWLFIWQFNRGVPPPTNIRPPFWDLFVLNPGVAALSVSPSEIGVRKVCAFRLCISPEKGGVASDFSKLTLFKFYNTELHHIETPLNELWKL